MSYIKRALLSTSNSEIENFLLKEGFVRGTNPVGYGNCLSFIAHGVYTVWFSVHESFIHLYAEYDCGGELGQIQYHFDKNDINSFMTAYYEAVEWAKGYVQ